jgi:hypothetical protein
LWFLLLGAFFCGKKSLDVLWVFSVLITKHAVGYRRPAGKDPGVTSDWLCMWREGGRAWSCYKCRGLSLCWRALLWLGLANAPPLAAGFLFLPALTGVAHWSVLEQSLVRGVRFGALSHNCVGVVGGALASSGPICSAACPQRRCNPHTTAMGSWEVHSDVGLVSAGEDTLWGVWGLVGGGGLRCCFGMFRVQMG